MTQQDARTQEARAIPVVEVAARLGLSNLKRAGQEMVGPCPACGGRDRFAINPGKNVWLCRHCRGGDGIALVELVMGCKFGDAVDWLVGAGPLQIDPAEAKRREDKRRADAAAANERARKERQKAIDGARSIWRQGVPTPGTAVEAYLARRGLPHDVAGRAFDCLRYHPDLPYTVPSEAGGWATIHRGPAMLAACLSSAGHVTAVHRTWLDLRRPKGKAVLSHQGDDLPAKKILGSKKGASIRFTHSFEVPERLVMGEGIETTLTALAADAVPGAAYWAGIDLGNMSGSRTIRGEGMKFAGVPDLTDPDAFIPPQGVRELVYIQDGDSEPRLTRAKLVAGLRRARAKVPSLEVIRIVHAGEGRDLNDILTEQETEQDDA